MNYVKKNYNISSVQGVEKSMQFSAFRELGEI
jgi:hypothetical protein